VAESNQIAGIYCRLSLARFGDTTKVEDQARICQEIARGRGWTVPPEHVYTDNSKSAWQRNRKRPGWDKMLADIEAGKFSNLVVYHGDRLVRHPADLEKLLDLADRGGMTITSPGGRRDLDVGSDRTMMRVEVAFAWQSSDDTARRKKDSFKRMAMRGIGPPAAGRYKRGFGYDTTGRIPVVAEADALREAALRVLDGEQLASIARDLTARGILSVSGVPLCYRTLKDALTRPRTAGLLTDGTPGSWEPILDRATWEMTSAVLLSRGRAANPRPSGARYLLSGVARCGLCGRGMQSTSSASHNRGYACVPPGCRKIRRDMALLDAYVITRVVRRLGNPSNPAPRDLTQDPVARQIMRLEERRREARETVETLADHPDADLGILTAALRSFDTRIAELRAQTVSDDARSRLLAAHSGITSDSFAALPLSVRRSLVRATFDVVVLPASKRGPGFNPADVRMTAR
jgi:site-specific DNA recombinase